jgi:phosphate starvation-inducible PhoH-like protein
MQALHNVESIAFCHFNDRDVIRHELVQAIVGAYRRHRGTAEPETKR